MSSNTGLLNARPATLPPVARYTREWTFVSIFWVIFAADGICVPFSLARFFGVMEPEESP
jgi:hypothetical protein